MPTLALDKWLSQALQDSYTSSLRRDYIHIGLASVSHQCSYPQSHIHSDKLSVDAVEVPLSPTVVQSPEPIYKDENICVYVAPVMPFSCKDFSPTGLEGYRAQEWRREVIREMFSGKISPKPSHDGRGKSHNVFFSQRDVFDGRVPVPAGFNQPLPQLVPPLMLRSPNQLVPTFAYVVVGPRSRGKFSNEKAKALGLPQGNIRAKLARGEIISFMMEDGTGNKVEKIVRPEDCIGKGDGRGVCATLELHSEDKP